jgi:hypothetical protein
MMSDSEIGVASIRRIVGHPDAGSGNNRRHHKTKNLSLERFDVRRRPGSVEVSGQSQDNQSHGQPGKSVNAGLAAKGLHEKSDGREQRECHGYLEGLHPRTGTRQLVDQRWEK